MYPIMAWYRVTLPGCAGLPAHGGQNWKKNQKIDFVRAKCPECGQTVEITLQEWERIQ
jgi:hypothetical protein